DLPEMSGEGAGAAIRLGGGAGGRSRPLAARRADSGPAERRPGTSAEVGEATAGDCRAGGGVGPGAARQPGRVDPPLSPGRAQGPCGNGGSHSGGSGGARCDRSTKPGRNGAEGRSGRANESGGGRGGDTSHFVLQPDRPRGSLRTGE